MINPTQAEYTRQKAFAAADAADGRKMASAAFIALAARL
jgi:hypothetical protein